MTQHPVGPEVGRDRLTHRSEEPVRMRRAVRILLALAACTTVGCGHGPTFQDRLGIMVRKAEVLSALRVDLLACADAEKSAVMAITDSASEAFAEESRQAAARVERGRHTLDSLLTLEHTADQERLAREFDTGWVRLREVDQEILGFAVQNTNLKAAALSFGPGQAAMDRFSGALQRLAERSARAGDCEAVRLAAGALAAGLQLHCLHAPHIAESSDARMDAMEAQMRQLAATVHADLGQLAARLPRRDADLGEARAADNEFDRLSAEVVRLSRQNTNVKSLARSLGTKRRLAAQCDQTLASLQEEVRRTEFQGTR